MSTVRSLYSLHASSEPCEPALADGARAGYRTSPAQDWAFFRNGRAEGTDPTPPDHEKPGVHRFARVRLRTYGSSLSASF